MKKKLFTDIYHIKLNGVAIAGWVAAGIYSVVSVIKDVIMNFN